MPDDPFEPDEPLAGPQATQEFRPEWDEEELRPLPRHTITAARTRPLPPRGPNRPQPRGTRRPPPPRSKPHRPAGAPRGRGGRRVLAVLALALIAGALYLINATFQPFHDDPSGAVRVTVPSGSDAGRIGEILASAGVIDSARLFEANATVTMRRGKLRPGKYQLPLGMSNGAAIEALMQGPQAKVVKTFSFTLPEGRSRRENIPLVNKAFSGDYGKATTEPGPAAAGAAPRLAAQRALARGLPVPGDLPDDHRGERERPRRAPARRVPREHRQGRPAHRAAPQPDALRRPHHRLDGRARGAAGEGAAADRRGDAQPPQGRASRSASTPPSATRSTTGSGRCASPSSSATRPTTRAPAAACRRRRSATRGSPRSRPPRTRPRPSTCSSCASPGSRVSTRSPAPTASSSATSRATRPPAAVRDLPRRVRVAGGPLPLAGDA